MALEFNEHEFRLPKTREEWLELKQIFIDKYKLIDEPQTWTFVLSQIQGVKMPALYTTFKNIIDHYKRWKIGAILQAEKLVYISELEAMLKAQLEKQVEQVADGAEDLNGDKRDIKPEWSDVQGRTQNF